MPKPKSPAPPIPTTTVRLPVAVHYDARIAAAVAGIPLMDWLVEACQAKMKRPKPKRKR